MHACVPDHELPDGSGAEVDRDERVAATALPHGQRPRTVRRHRRVRQTHPSGEAPHTALEVRHVEVPERSVRIPELEL